MQRAAVELLLLSIPAGILGSWIVLRRLAFFAHAVGPATFPALVVAQAASINPQAAALIFASIFTGSFDWMTRRTKASRDTATGLILVGSLALGALLASDVFASSGQVDTLLFGSVLSTGTTELGLTLVVAALTIVSFAVFRRSWLASGFDLSTAGSVAKRTKLADRLLLLISAVAIATSVFAVGALLVSALFVVPAATVRMVTGSIRSLIAGSVILASTEGLFAIWLAYQINLPPGTALALTAGAAFFATTVFLEIRSTASSQSTLGTQLKGIER